MKGPERKKCLEKDMMTIDNTNSFKLGYDKSEELSLIILKCGRLYILYYKMKRTLE
jgi:hypothetical protein